MIYLINNKFYFIMIFLITVLMPNLKKQEDDLQLMASVNTNLDDVSVCAGVVSL